VIVFQAKGDRDSYECRVCLFSLSISDVLVFNVHENIMNLYQASGQVLLKTIFRGHFAVAHYGCCNTHFSLFSVNAKNMTAEQFDASSPSRSRVLLLYVIRSLHAKFQALFCLAQPDARLRCTFLFIFHFPQRRIRPNALGCQQCQRAVKNATTLG
jgi:hypothetical protein